MIVCKIIGHKIVQRNVCKNGEITDNLLICKRCGKVFQIKNYLAKIIEKQIEEGEQYLKNIADQIYNNGVHEVAVGAALMHPTKNTDVIRHQLGILKNVLTKWKECKKLQ